VSSLLEKANPTKPGGVSCLTQQIFYLGENNGYPQCKLLAVVLPIFFCPLTPENTFSFAMLNCFKTNTPCLPKWWMPWVLKHAAALLAVILCCTVMLLFYIINNFKINTDLTEMISNDLPFRQVVNKYHQAFPDLAGSLLVVIEGSTPEQTRVARDALADRLRKQPDVFASVFTPGAGSFFDQSGLLYLSTEELERQGDRLAAMQPFFAMLSQDFSLAGLFSVLQKVVEQDAITGNGTSETEQLMTDLGEIFTGIAEGGQPRMSWQHLMLSRDAASENTQFILLQPVLNYRVMNPARKGIKIIRQTARELQLAEKHGVTVHITGKPAINYEDMRSVRTDITVASLVSFVLVGITLYLGLWSIRLVVAGLSTLIIGLIWTIGFALLLVGRLNMISITFVVLFIGLGIDYSIQIVLRYKEFLSSGSLHKEAIEKAINASGNALLLCSLSTAIGFFSFVPTAYVGASELGLISGMGMLIILLASITVLPAMMNLIPQKKNLILRLAVGGLIARFIRKYSRSIVATATVLALAALIILPGISFDSNPLHLSDQRSEAVRTAMQLFQKDTTSPWTLSILTSDRQEAAMLAKQVKQLPEVAKVIWIENFIPKKQEEKLELIEDIALFMPPVPERQEIITEAQYQLDKDSLADLSKTLREQSHTGAEGEKSSAIHNLAAGIDAFEQRSTDPDQRTFLFQRLNSALLPNLEILLKRLHTLLGASLVGFEDLPPDLVSRYLSANGLYRLQVFPQQDLRNIDNLKRFVASVQAVAPEATDQPVTVLRAGETIVSAFKNASIFALVLISAFLWIVTKSWKEVLLVLAPLLLALCYTVAAAVLLNIPFNFANIIVVPLLLGIGVDSSLHIVHRIKETGELDMHILETSSSRAVLFSSLTTVMSFGSLSFMHHAGTAGMGKMLTLSVTMSIFCTLLVLPAFLELYNPYKKRG
jgi:hopanoid biosynthesis associated RND transporter like protein HpnN